MDGGTTKGGAGHFESVAAEDILQTGFGGQGKEYEDRATEVQLAFERWCLRQKEVRAQGDFFSVLTPILERGNGAVGFRIASQSVRYPPLGRETHFSYTALAPRTSRQVVRATRDPEYG